MVFKDRIPLSADSGQLQLPLQLPRHGAEPPRHILLCARIVTYALTRSRRRSLGMSIDQRGLRIGAPLGARIREVEDFIRANAEWVLRKLDAWQAASRQSRILVSDGARLPLLGEPWTLRVTHGEDETRWCEHTRELNLAPRPATEPRQLLLRELRVRALAVLHQRAGTLIRPLDRPLPRVALSNAQTRWGSCSSKSGLRFNWRLIHLPLRLVDYVVAHELGHLLEMNHSPRFWRVVECLYPDYQGAREELRAHALSMPVL